MTLHKRTREFNLWCDELRDGCVECRIASKKAKKKSWCQEHYREVLSKILERRKKRK